MIEVRINGEPADLPKDIGFEQSFQVFDIASLTTVKSDSTSSIDFPMTSRNIELFGIQGGSNNAGDTRYRRMRADVIIDGVNVMPNSSCVVQEVGGVIRCNLFRGSFDLFTALGEKLLSDLDLSGLNHRRDAVVITANRYSTSGFIYPVVNYGKLEITSNVFSGNWQLPSVFFSTIVSKIMEEAGFLVSGSILQDEGYKDTVLLLSTVNPGEESDNEMKVGRAQLSASATYSGSASVNRYVLSSTNFDFSGLDFFPMFLPTNVPGLGLPAPASVANPSVNGYTVRSEGMYKFTGSVTVTANNVIPGNPLKCFLYVEKKNTTGTTSRVISPSVDVFGGTATYNVASDWERLAFGDFVVVAVQIPITTASPQETVTILLANVTCVDIRDTIEQPYYTTYDVANNMPEITQKEFLKGVMGMFQVIPIPNTDTGDVELWSYNDAYLRLGIAIDLSSKVTGTPVRTFKIPGYARVNLLKYSNESEGEIVELYGSGEISIDDETISEAEKTIVEIPFSASRQIYNGLKGIIPVTYLLHVYNTTTGFYDSNVDGVRVARIKRFPTIDTIVFRDDKTSSDVTTNVTTVYFFFNETGYPSLGFSDSDNAIGLITTYYAGLEQLFAKSEVLKVPIRLTAIDIANIDFSVPVYLREYGANFIINKINGYREGIAEIELIRM